MTRNDLIAHYEFFILPIIVESYELDGMADYPARREAWNNMIDSLERAGEITAEEAFNDAGLPDRWDNS